MGFRFLFTSSLWRQRSFGLAYATTNTSLYARGIIHAVQLSVSLHHQLEIENSGDDVSRPAACRSSGCSLPPHHSSITCAQQPTRSFKRRTAQRMDVPLPQIPYTYENNVLYDVNGHRSIRTPQPKPNYGGTCAFGVRWSLLSDYYSTSETICYYSDEGNKLSSRKPNHVKFFTIYTASRVHKYNFPHTTALD